MEAAPRPHIARDHLAAFASEIDAIGRAARARLGDEDVSYIRRVIGISRASGLAGRVLIAVSLEPMSFALGVSLLSLHKILAASEIGHAVLHGAYDALDPSGELTSRKFRWEFPVDEDAWRHGHNLRHHRYVGIVGRDADTAFGFLRLTDKAPHRLLTFLQFPATVLGALPSFGVLGQLHFTGVFDLAFEPTADRRPRAVLATLVRAARKPLRYWARNYALYPAFAGPLAPKVVIGTWLAERVRDIWVGLVILCGHTGPEVAAFVPGTRARGKGEYYKMQVEATNDFEVPHAVSILAGALDLQIEHHLFPDLPPNRLREIKHDVRAVCARHGVVYRAAPFVVTALRAFRHIARLSLPNR
jgi:fatty acid desaturase